MQMANGYETWKAVTCGENLFFLSWAMQFQELFSTANSQERQANVITKLINTCGWLIKLQGLVAHF